MAVTKWMRLDVDFWHDPKFTALLSEKSKSVAFDAVRLYCMATAKHGQIDLSDPIERKWVESELSLRGKKLDTLLSTLAEFRIIDADDLDEGVIPCGRLRNEAARIDVPRPHRKDGRGMQMHSKRLCKCISRVKMLLHFFHNAVLRNDTYKYNLTLLVSRDFPKFCTIARSAHE